MGKKIWSKIKDIFTEFRICVKNTWILLQGNWKPVAIFAALNVFVSIFGTTFFADIAFSIIYSVTGFTYLGQNNLKEFFLAPVTIICILAFFLIIGTIAIFEIAALLHAFDMSQIGKKTSFSAMISKGVKVCMKVVRPRNWVMLPFVLILLPFTGIVNLVNSFISVSIPGFILSFIFANNVLALLFSAACIILSLIVLFNIHALNFFSLSDDSFLTSCKKSKELMKKNVWSTIIYLIMFSILFMLVITALSSMIGGLAAKILSWFNTDSKEVLTQSRTVARAISTAEKFCTGLILPLLNLASLATLFYRKLKMQDKLNELSDEAFEDEKASRPVVIICSVLAISMLCYNFWAIGVKTVAYREDINVPYIIAHRGDSVYAPENTMPAFEMAKMEGVDGVELDVHETKDGVIIVSHDDNLLRVSGQDVNVHDLTYEETQKLEVGSWFNKEYQGTKLSTLDEVLKIYKDTEIEIQVEIKPTPYDHQIEEKVLEVINNNGMHDRCIIISLKEEPLKRIKELDNTMKTGYCMFIAVDNIQDIEFADYLSVEESYIEPYLVYKVHSAGKKIYTWTVNDQSNVQYLVYCNVDGILTDDPLMLWEAFTMVNFDNGLARIITLALNRMVKGY